MLSTFRNIIYLRSSFGMLQYAISWSCAALLTSILTLWWTISSVGLSAASAWGLLTLVHAPLQACLELSVLSLELTVLKQQRVDHPSQCLYTIGQASIGDNFGESLGGSQAPRASAKFPWLPRNFPEFSGRAERVSTKGYPSSGRFLEISLKLIIRNYCIKCPKIGEIWPFHGYPFCGYPF